MITHYFTLRALSRELDLLCCGWRIAEVFTQQKNELEIGLIQNEAESWLSISIEPAHNYIFLREKFSRAKKNSLDLFSEFIGTTISGITIHSSDRALLISGANGLVMNVQLYNTSASNIVLTDERGTIRESFKCNKELHGTKLELPKERFASTILTDCTKFSAALCEQETENIFSALKKSVPILGSTIAREALHRSSIPEHTLVEKISENNLADLFETVGIIMRELEHPRPTLYFRGEAPRVLSVVPLRHLDGSTTEVFESVNDAVRTALWKGFKEKSLDSEKKGMIGRIKTLLDKTRRTAEALQEQVMESRRAEEYDRIGKVIMANLQHLTKGTKEIELPDIFDRDKPIRISLDPKLTPARNAERYFGKAKKAKLARVESEQRLNEYREKIRILEKLLLHLDHCQTADHIKEFKNEYEHELSSLHLLSKKKEEDRPPFRIFIVAGGFEVLVGKSSENNDLLTMKYAKPNDLWFHARGASGSHTVLRVKNGNTLPPKESIHQAARIAAYYSKMRKAGNVPVAYCERKYVRKPKGAAAGSVVLEREKVIFVEPKLP